jgi:hypothetical protein
VVEYCQWSGMKSILWSWQLTTTLFGTGVTPVWWTGRD